jgi:hypothetical protein
MCPGGQGAVMPTWIGFSGATATSSHRAGAGVSSLDAGVPSPCQNAANRLHPIRRAIVIRHLAPVACLALAAPALNAAPLVAVYESEANAAIYAGAHQQHLRYWLKDNRYAFDVVGDAVASDPAKLAAYAVVIATNTYVLPDTAAEGLSRYVAEGGQLIWVDGPARSTDARLLATLGIAGRFRYAPGSGGRFTPLNSAHPACAGITACDAEVTGNPALEATGEVLATLSGVPADGADSQGLALPAVIATKTGRGRAVLLNWIIWLGQGAPGTDVFSNVLAWFLADRSTAAAPVTAHLTRLSSEVAQPQPITFSVRAFATAQQAGKTAKLTVRLRGPGRGSAGPPLAGSLRLARLEGENLCCGVAGFRLSTAGLADGEYFVTVAGEAGEVKLPRVSGAVRLNGQLLARLEREDQSRGKLLRPLLTGLLGDYDSEPRTSEGRMDLPRLFTQIEAAHMNMYDFLIWHADTDWEDFQLFVAEAKRRGLKVWVTLAPPSEPPPSAPFGLDYLRWADEIGKLAARYDNLVGVVIDDFCSGGNERWLGPATVSQFAATLRSYNPKVAFLPTVYWGTVGNLEFLRQYGHALDGIVFPYADLVSTARLPEQLAACRKWLGPNKLLFINGYAAGSSGDAEPGPRTPEYMRSMLETSREMCDGIRLYCLPKDDFTDPRFAVTAELYAKWRQSR